VRVDDRSRRAGLGRWAADLAVALGGQLGVHRPRGATPNLVGEDDLVAANAAESVIAQISYFAGPVSAGGGRQQCGRRFPGEMLLTLLRPLLVGVGDIGGGARGASRAGTHADDGPGDGEGRSRACLAGLGEGVARRVRGLAALTGFTSAAVFLFGYEQVVHVLVADDRLHGCGRWACWPPPRCR
jgi:hypothetical protein